MGHKMVPITLAAVGPHGLRLAGEVGDGARLHGFCTRRYLAEFILPHVQEGMVRTNRTRAHFEITGGGFIATGPDEAATARAFEVIRGRVAFYGSTPGYWGVLELYGLGDLGRELNVMSKQCKWAEMATRVSDDVVHLFTAVGTHKEIAKRLEGRFGGLSDAVNMRTGEVNTQRSTVPSEPTSEKDIPPDLLQDIKRIPTPFKGYNTAWRGQESLSRALPPQPIDHSLAHDQLQVAAFQPWQFLGEHRHAFAIATGHSRDVRSPEEPVRPECIVDPMQTVMDAPEWIGR